MPRTKQQEFQISLHIKLELAHTIRAESMEEAIRIARTICVTDVLDLDSSAHNDSSIRLISVYDKNAPLCD